MSKPIFFFFFTINMEDSQSCSIRAEIRQFQFYQLVAKKLDGLAWKDIGLKETVEGAGRKGNLLFPDGSAVDTLVMSSMWMCLFDLPSWVSISFKKYNGGEGGIYFLYFNVIGFFL